MNKRIGCLHAHHSNIAYIERAFAGTGAELLHFVDPALLYRISSDAAFSPGDARRKVKEQLEWISQAGVDAILVTCTNYIAVLREAVVEVGVPIVKIDEPFFEALCAYGGEQLLLFTNPATVEGTMARLREYSRDRGREPNVEVRVLEGVFELVMQGKLEEHLLVLADRLRELTTEAGDKRISVAQLSMVDAAEQVQSETGVLIGHSLGSLKAAMDKSFFADG